MGLQQTAQKIMDVLSGGFGYATTALRRAVIKYAAGTGGCALEGGEVPSDLVSYVEKVSRFAYKVTDEDVEALRARGYSEDQIFEVTLAAAFGAAYARKEAGLRALKGGR